jgi:hypothetical protein
MSPTRPMNTLRRPMPGMPSTAAPVHSLPAKSEPSPAPLAGGSEKASEDPPRRARREASASSIARARRESGPRRWAASNYSNTRLANFRLPADLHDRYRELVRQVEQTHPRLRRPSLTELIIALLEEGPRTPDEVAELIRRKRTAENAEEVSR